MKLQFEVLHQALQERFTNLTEFRQVLYSVTEPLRYVFGAECQGLEISFVVRGVFWTCLMADGVNQVDIHFCLTPPFGSPVHCSKQLQYTHSLDEERLATEVLMEVVLQAGREFAGYASEAREWFFRREMQLMN